MSGETFRLTGVKTRTVYNALQRSTALYNALHSVRLQCAAARMPTAAAAWSSSIFPCESRLCAYMQQEQASGQPNQQAEHHEREPFTMQWSRSSQLEPTKPPVRVALFENNIIYFAYFIPAFNAGIPAYTPSRWAHSTEH